MATPVPSDLETGEVAILDLAELGDSCEVVHLLVLS